MTTILLVILAMVTVGAAGFALVPSALGGGRAEKRRKALQAKFVLVFSTAVFSSYATYTALRYLDSGAFQPISLVVLAVLATVIGDRWRAA